MITSNGTNHLPISSFFTITGFIRTDGHIGSLLPINVIDWDLHIAAPSFVSGDILGPLSGNNTTTKTVFGTALTATTTGLFYDFSATGDQRVELSASTALVTLCGVFIGCPLGQNSSLIAYLSFGASSPLVGNPRAEGGLTQIGVAETPLPAALSLFASGLAALGLLGWRRKRHT